MSYYPLNAQCYVKKSFTPLFTEENNPQLLYVCKIGPDVSSKYVRVMHAHDDLVELVLIYSGSSNYLIHDRKQAVKAGDLLIYNAGVVHDEMSCADSNLGFYCIGVGGLRMPGLKKDAVIAEEQGYRFSTGEYFEEIRQLYEMMFQNLSNHEPDAERFCNSLMQALLSKVLTVVNMQTQGNDDDEIDKLDPDVLGKRIKNYIDEHYAESVSIETIGKALHMSPWYVSHVFKEMSGYSPIQYLLRRRIGEAQTLLISTDYSITEIAFRVGFDTQSYFNMQFTKNVGMPPMQFRKNYLVKEENPDSSKKKRGRSSRDEE